jgi:hypothetical protein
MKTYILESNRKNKRSILRIPYLAEIHEIILNNTNISFHELDTITEMQIIMDSTQVGADSIWMQKQNRNLAI